MTDDFVSPARARAAREFTAEAIKDRLPPAADACTVCAQHPDKPCYMPPHRCPRPPQHEDDDERGHP